MLHYATLADAQHIAREWNARSATIEHIGDSGSSIFQFRNPENELQILRLTENEPRKLFATD